jgi:hypothetical protein
MVAASAQTLLVWRTVSVRYPLHFRPFPSSFRFTLRFVPPSPTDRFPTSLRQTVDAKSSLATPLRLHHRFRGLARAHRCHPPHCKQSPRASSSSALSHSLFLTFFRQFLVNNGTIGVLDFNNCLQSFLWISAVIDCSISVALARSLSRRHASFRDKSATRLSRWVHNILATASYTATLSVLGAVIGTATEGHYRLVYISYAHPSSSFLSPSTTHPFCPPATPSSPSLHPATASPSTAPSGRNAPSKTTSAKPPSPVPRSSTSTSRSLRLTYRDRRRRPCRRGWL